MSTRHWSYGQSAVVANVSVELPHYNIAYERFTDSGPMALLPMSEQRCALVCSVGQARAERLMEVDDAAFLEFVQGCFGDRLGRFLKVGERQTYPLVHLKSHEQARARVAVVGNAAHTLHPVAGQGFNLGLRDVAVLAEVICDAHRVGEDIGGWPVLQRYADWRRGDQSRTSYFTDALVRVFGSPLAPLRLARDFGLVALDLLPPVKHRLAKNAMGLAGRLPRLARGVPL